MKKRWMLGAVVLLGVGCDVVLGIEEGVPGPKCTVDADCSTSTSECSKNICIAGACQSRDIEYGAPAGINTPGDCKKTVCDARGDIKNDEPDPDDFANDDNPCTEDKCIGTSVAHSPMPFDSPCGASGSLTCDGNGACVGCTETSQCTPPTNPCQMAQCAGGSCQFVNVTNGTTCDDGDPCTQTDTCQSGVCVGANPVGCASDQVCIAGTCENVTWGRWPMPNPAGAGLPNPASYTVDVSKGVVVDNVTKLMWQREVDPGKYTWEEAKAYCANLVLGGYSNWRLPTRIELVSLVDFTRAQPSIDAGTFPNTPSEWFWTSSPLADSPLHVWAVNFGNGRSSYAGTTRVRCVRR